MPYKMVYLARRAPTVSWEDWPRTWRSHAVFASQFPALTGSIDWLVYATRVSDPSLGDLPVSTEHDGVSIQGAQTLGPFLGEAFTREQRAMIDEDELRVFDRYTPEFSFYCTEASLVDGPIGDAAVFRFLRRRPQVSRADFEAHLKGEYADLCKAAADTLGAQRWTLNTTVEPPPEDFPFEMIDEFWFPTVRNAADALTAPAMQQLTASLTRVCAPEHEITMLTRPTQIWPRSLRP